MILKKLLHYSRVLICRKAYFGFLRGHDYIGDEQIKEISRLIGVDNAEIVKQYEDEFVKLIDGDGYCVSFAAGRMAFYSFLKAANVGIGDEVILTGFTCSVMSNAVLRAGATPVYADISLDNYGSDPESIRSKITTKTKVIVAQHSFGIPCNIEAIVEIAKVGNILLVEDCAIALGSSVDGKKVGSFGDASIFSTDHSKPLNTITGGMLFTKNKDFFIKVKEIRDFALPLDEKKQLAIFEQFIFERKYQNPKNYLLSKIISFISLRIRKLLHQSVEGAFLTADYSELTINNRYPYPAKLPPFLAKIGILELDRWAVESRKRVKLLSMMLDIVKKQSVHASVPNAYFDKRLEIIPLRFVFNGYGQSNSKEYLNGKIDTDWFWFKLPIVCAENLEKLGYLYGGCMVSERLGLDIINFPVLHDEMYSDEILDILEKFLVLRASK